MRSLSRRCTAAAARTHRRALLRQLESGWTVTPTGHLLRTYEFRDFAGAVAFASRVAVIAEEQGHHPDLHVAWGQCGVEIWTHKIDGLTESDFFLAARPIALFAFKYPAHSKFWNLQDRNAGDKPAGHEQTMS